MKCSGKIKFSVLIPTRNRLEYLKYAIQTVQLQGYTNWEIIISDNCSDVDNEGYVQSLNDSRIKFFKTDSFVSVTENWNKALERSSGDYVIMLGDDDGLLQGYFSTCCALIERHEFPDMIYASALNYTYPGVLSDKPAGELVKHGYAAFFQGKREPFLLEKQVVRKCVTSIMNFRVVVNFNPQHSLISMSLVRKMAGYGKFYQSAYPDYYATIALLIKAEKILAVPHPMVIIGITPKSFGYYHFNSKEAEGVQFLGNQKNRNVNTDLEDIIIPGADMNISWLLTLDLIVKNFGKEYDLKIHYFKFRLLQQLQQCKKFIHRNGVSFRELFSFSKYLLWKEKFIFFLFCLLSLALRFFSHTRLARGIANRMADFLSHPYFPPQRFLGRYMNIMDVFYSKELQ